MNRHTPDFVGFLRSVYPRILSVHQRIRWLGGPAAGSPPAVFDGILGCRSTGVDLDRIRFSSRALNMSSSVVSSRPCRERNPVHLMDDLERSGAFVETGDAYFYHFIAVDDLQGGVLDKLGQGVHQFAGSGKAEPALRIAVVPGDRIGLSSTNEPAQRSTKSCMIRRISSFHRSETDTICCQEPLRGLKLAPCSATRVIGSAPRNRSSDGVSRPLMTTTWLRVS